MGKAAVQTHIDKIPTARSRHSVYNGCPSSLQQSWGEVEDDGSEDGWYVAGGLSQYPGGSDAGLLVSAVQDAKSAVAAAKGVEARMAALAAKKAVAAAVAVAVAVYAVADVSAVAAAAVAEAHVAVAALESGRLARRVVPVVLSLAVRKVAGAADATMAAQTAGRAASFASRDAAETVRLASAAVRAVAEAARVQLRRTPGSVAGILERRSRRFFLHYPLPTHVRRAGKEVVVLVPPRYWAYTLRIQNYGRPGDIITADITCMDIQEDGFPSDDYEFEDGVLEGPRWVAEGVAADAAWVASKASEAAAAVLMRL